MSKQQNYGVQDPPLEIEYEDIDLYEMEQIIDTNGELTPYGEELYWETQTMLVYDEIDGRWIYV